MRGLERGLAEEDAVVRDDPNAEALDAREAAHQRGAIQRLELVKAGPVDQPRDDLVHVVLRSNVFRDEGVKIGWVVRRWLGQRLVVHAPVRGALELRDDLACDGDRVRIVEREVIRDARNPRVEVGSAEVLGGNINSRGGLHQRWPADEDRPLTFDDHRLVAHGRHICAAGGRRSHHERDLRDRKRRESGLVVKDPPEMLAVGEDFVLSWQERATRINEVQAGKSVLEGDLLRA